MFTTACKNISLTGSVLSVAVWVWSVKRGSHLITFGSVLISRIYSTYDGGFWSLKAEGCSVVLDLDSKGFPDSLSSCLDDDILSCVEFGPATVGVLSSGRLLCVIDAPTCKTDV